MAGGGIRDGGYGVVWGGGRASWVVWVSVNIAYLLHVVYLFNEAYLVNLLH